MSPAASSSQLDPSTLHRLIQVSFQGRYLISRNQTPPASFKQYPLAYTRSGRDNAYAPYSNFKVGAALLTKDGSMISGCNVENASYGAGICAERTAMVKAVSHGQTTITAVAVSSLLPEPTISPCGICRQFLREFLPLHTPVFMLAAQYPYQSNQVPGFLSAFLDAPHEERRWTAVQGRSGGGETAREGSEEWREYISVMTLGELLPMSFGPDQLVGFGNK